MYTNSGSENSQQKKKKKLYFDTHWIRIVLHYMKAISKLLSHNQNEVISSVIFLSNRALFLYLHGLILTQVWLGEFKTVIQTVVLALKKCSIAFIK